MPFAQRGEWAGKAPSSCGQPQVAAVPGAGQCSWLPQEGDTSRLSSVSKANPEQPMPSVVPPCPSPVGHREHPCEVEMVRSYCGCSAIWLPPPPQPQKMFLWLGFKLIATCCFSLWSTTTQISGAITVRCLTVWAVLVQNHRPLYTAAKRAFTFLSCSANGAVSVLQQSVTTVTVINKSVWARKLYSSRKEWKLIYKLFEYAALLPVELHHSCLCSSLSVVINLQPAALWARQPGRWKECFHSSFRWSFRVELAKNKPLNATGPSTIHSTAGGSVRLISFPARFRTIRLFSLFWWNCVCWYLHIVSEFVWAGRDSPGSRSSGIESQHHEDVFRDYFIFSLWISETAHQMVGWSVFPLLGTTLFSLFFFSFPLLN